MAYEVLMPQLGLTMEEGTVSAWKKHEGDSVKVGDVLLEITTDKLSHEILSEYEGTLLRIAAREGEDVPVKGLLACIGEVGETADSETADGGETPPLPAAEDALPARGEVARVRISPLARKTAKKLGVDYSGLTGSGASGRICQADILALAGAADSVPPSEAAAVSHAEHGGGMEGDNAVKISGMRKVVSQRMLAAHREIPPVTQNIRVDVTELMKLRQLLLETTGRKYSVNDLVLKATAKCLRAHPEMLVSLEGDQIVHHTHVHLGMAVAIEGGLIVPVIRDADRMGLEELTDTAGNLARRARENKLSAGEIQGSTFSVSNLGMFGIESFTPIINQPNAAILGICAVQEEAAVDDDGAVTKRQIMRLSVTLDHRLLDGAVVARFEMDLRDLLQNCMNILV